MTQLAEQAVGDANDPVDAAGSQNPAEDIADFLGLEEDEEQPEGDEAQAEPPEEDEQEAEPAEPAIEPPASWKADGKELFKSLPPEMQKTIADRETERERFVQTKAQEAANTRQTVENEARAVLAQQAQQAAQQLRQYEALITPQRPDPAMLQYDAQGFYAAQAQYEASVAQRQHAQQQAEQYEAEANAQRQHIEQAAQRAEVETLRTEFPEWFDPSAGANHQQTLTAIAREMGYSDDHVAQARAVDILAMRRAADWKAKAEKWDAANKAKMTNVRAAKDLPKVTKSGVARGAPNPQQRKEAAWQNVQGATSKEARESAFADYLGL